MAGSEDWYVVNFPVAFDFAQHGAGAPRILFSQNDATAFRFDVYGGCGGAAMTCAAEGTSGLGLTDWQYFDNCVAPGCTSRSASWPATVYVRVRRITAGTDCSAYRITASR
jgi:hypothetical protein